MKECRNLNQHGTCRQPGRGCRQQAVDRAQVCWTVCICRQQPGTCRQLHTVPVIWVLDSMRLSTALGRLSTAATASKMAPQPLLSNSSNKSSSRNKMQEEPAVQAAATSSQCLQPGTPPQTRCYPEKWQQHNSRKGCRRCRPVGARMSEYDTGVTDELKSSSPAGQWKE
ncbi:hypothetical protein Taro_044201 [Colocasia esculenta]|uniref:Uncharacterized protein n=1 Tax=Colocasia esculenta TaxID=4460 RepID=A0A843WTZ0_COLES|nr:hypothetical protein [Colocasia esculenta]